MPAVQLLYQSAIDGLTESTSRIGIINAHAHPLLKELSEKVDELTILQHFRPEYDKLTRTGVKPSQHLDGQPQLILLFPSKNKQQSLGWMAEAMLNLSDDGKLLIACANKHGARSYEAALKALAGNTSSTSKSKCRVLSARRNDALNTELAEKWIFDAKPGEVKELGLISQPGLFSWNRADTGSQLLLKHLPDSLVGAGMDLCCGYGFLSTRILERNPDIDSFYLVDADRFALNCAEKNMKRWCEKVKSCWLDAVADPLPPKLDWIVCNPPFHSGQTQDISLGQSIIANACSSLKRGGRLFIVANRKLPYEATLDKRLMQHHILIQEQGFKVIEAVKGKRK